ncbi:FecR family protein [Chitinophaga sp. XS-30]|uniref:FecR family protein n=1 Tax=Chitinophaga sp. XS-30 TaxID=2604421 RepID=UPI0011DD60A2|nr:FecR domain-containing protein [Chitinophaga sp. XS-30]QEH43209.1 DUF4974 domain-containing protein [Chitinophaga sp. XS-30]
MSIEPSNIDWGLVYAILAGEADEAQEARWKELFLSSEAYRQLYDQLKPAFREAEKSMTFVRLQAVSALHTGPETGPEKPRRWSRRSRVRAASLLTMLTVLFVIFPQSKPPEEKAVTWQQISAAPGRSTVITFPEGSTVRLAPTSSIRFPNEFDPARREVFLTGEGYFNITRDSARPFFVHTQHISTKVLGTAFQVQQDSAAQVRITLVEGKVQVQRDSSTLATLQPRQAFTYDAAAGNWEIRSISSAEAGVLAGGGIVFEATPLQEVALLLEKYFDMKVQFSDPALGKLRFTSMFSQPSLTSILQAIRASNKIDYTIRDNTILFIRKK